MSPKKVTLHLPAFNGAPFHCAPASDIEIDSDLVLCNDPVMPWEFNMYTSRLWVIGNEYGALCAVWAAGEQDALDEACDAGMLAGLSCSEEDIAADQRGEVAEGVMYLGNAGEPHDSTHAWIRPVKLDEQKDCRLLCAFAEARGADYKNLEAVW